MLNLLESSPYFVKCRTKQDMANAELEFLNSNKEPDHVYWTTASPTSVIAMSNGANYKLISSPGGLLGQAQPLDEPVKKPDGTYVPMGSLKVGDKVASPSEGESTVLGVFPQGKKACYRVTLADGRSTRCSANHLWKVWYRKPGITGLIEGVVTLQFMMDRPDWEFFVYDDADCAKGESA
jgi:hypothetical protein